MPSASTRPAARFAVTETFDLDWIERLTGFIETDYASTRAKLKVRSGKLISLINGVRYRTGLLELASLSDLRNQVRSVDRSMLNPVDCGYLSSAVTSERRTGIAHLSAHCFKLLRSSICWK